MTLEDVDFLALIDIPDTDGSIGRAGDERVSTIRQSPYATFMALQSFHRFSSLCVVNVDVGIVTSSDDLVLVKLQTGHNMSLTCSECEMFWF